MRTLLTIIITICIINFTNAQSVNGKLTLNGKSKTELKLKSNSAVQLFKAFKTGEYKLKFAFDSKEIPKNIYKESILFFEFITQIKKDGKLVKNVQRKQPIPYFPGEMFIPAEAFDFIGVLAKVEENTKEMTGIMPKGKYTVQLIIKPVNFKGEIDPLEFSFNTPNPSN